MLLLPDSMIAILNSGGGLIVDARGLLPNTLADMASCAQNSGARLVIRHCEALLPNTMEQIASAGGGQVTFDLTEE
jgi:predicted kinase